MPPLFSWESPWRRIPSNSLQIAIAKNGHVVRDVSRNEIGQGANCHPIAAYDPFTLPACGRHVSEEGDRRRSNLMEFVDVGGPADAVSLSSRRADSFIEADKGIRESASKPERAIREGTLGIGGVIQQLSNTPLFRRVSMERLLFGNLPEGREAFLELTLQNSNRIVAGNPIDVGETLRGGFVAFRSGDHRRTLTQDFLPVFFLESDYSGIAGQHEGSLDEFAVGGEQVESLVFGHRSKLLADLH